MLTSYLTAYKILAADSESQPSPLSLAFSQGFNRQPKSPSYTFLNDEHVRHANPHPFLDYHGTYYGESRARYLPAPSRFPAQQSPSQLPQRCYPTIPSPSGGGCPHNTAPDRSLPRGPDSRDLLDRTTSTSLCFRCRNQDSAGASAARPATQ